MKYGISNNKLMEMFTEEIDFPHEKAWEDELFGEEEGILCNLCSTVIEGVERADVLKHLNMNHKKQIKDILATKGEE